MHDYEGLVKKFSSEMIIQLEGNASRGFGFREHISRNEGVPNEMFDELEANCVALNAACTEGLPGSPSLIEQRALILERAADVANMALLIALNTGSISPPMPEEAKS